MKRKGEKKLSLMEELKQNIDASRGEYIRSRFSILEVTPPQRCIQGDGHGGSEIIWIGEKRVAVSDFFDTREEAKAFMDEHEPDEGNSLKIVEHKLYRKVVETWY